LDTNVLVPQMLRDVLLSSAEGGLYQLFWSQEILDELRRNLGRAGGVAPERVDRVILTMQAAFPDAMVAAWPRSDVDDLPNDPGDRHVLATAIEAGARSIVTHNVRHFQRRHLERHGIEALTPDDFLIYLLKTRRNDLLTVIGDISSGLTRPHLTPVQIMRALSKVAPRFSTAAMEALR